MCYIIGSESTAAFGAGQRPTASAVGFFIGEPMETNYDKPFKTFEEQIDILKSRNLIITNKDFALDVLRSVSYYDLSNGYKTIFMQNDTFRDGLTLEYLYEFFLLDKDIQSIVIKYGLIAENLFKNQFSYVIGKNCGVDHTTYLNPKLYQESVSGVTFQKNILKETSFLFNPKTSKDPTKYYLINHNHIPPWILFKNISLGTSINFYKLLKTNEKIEVTRNLLPYDGIEYKVKVEMLTRALDTIRKFRNHAAHNLNFVTCKSSAKLPINQIATTLPGTLRVNHSGKVLNHDKKCTARLYGLILCILLLLPTRELKNLFYLDLHNAFENVSRYRLYNGIQTNTAEDYLKLTKLPFDLFKRIRNILK